MKTISPELKKTLKKLKLGPILATLPERIVLAEKQKLSVEETLLLVLSDEVARREAGDLQPSSSTRGAALPDRDRGCLERGTSASVQR